MNVRCLATGSTGNCYLVNTNSGCIILDAGIKVEKIIKNVNLNDVLFAFISHSHKDHNLSAPKLADRGVQIVGGNLYRPFDKITLGKKIDNKFQVFTFPVKHGAYECHGIIINELETNESLLYITDFTVCEYDLSQFEFTHVIVECNYCDALVNGHEDYKVKRQINTHMSLTGIQIFLDTLNLSNCKEILLVHQSQGLGDPIIMGATIYSKYGIKTGVCRQYGGIDYYG